MKTKDISTCAFSVALLVLCSKLTIPFGWIPLTLQTLGVMLCGLLLTRKQITITFSTYIIAGLCGLPLFANGGGFAYLLQPSFGFILSFPIAAYILCIWKQKYNASLASILIGSCIALLCIYTIGALYMYMIFAYVLLLDKSILDVISIGVLPFIMNDTISTICACCIAQRILCAVPYFKHMHSTIS